MTSDDQKRLWQQEKQQQKLDKQNQKKVVQKNPVNLSFGGKTSKPQQSKRKPMSPPGSILPDEFLRQNLGI